jgi:hypothetical protein
MTKASAHVLASLLVVLAIGTACADDSTPDRSVFTSRSMPYGTFDRMPQTHLKVGGADIRMAVAPGEFDLGFDRLRAWIEHSAEVVSGYYGRFPVDSARILVVPVSGQGVRTGVSFGFRGAATKVFVGSSVTEAQLKDDWVLIHEMTHFAFPDLDESHLWMQEGQATYIEGVARVQAGDLDAREVWGEFMQQMPKGLPRSGDEGLDRTHTWGRTYWGGALFCLWVDVEIRKRTQLKRGLQDALRAVVNAGGNTTQDWSLEKAIAIGDKAVGVDTLEKTYARLRYAPGDIDLDQLFKDLGVRRTDAGVTFDDDAPLAAARKEIMTRH